MAVPEECSVCHRICSVKRRKGGILCSACYQKTYRRPSFICSSCGRKTNSGSRGLCSICYGKQFSQPLKECNKCGCFAIIHGHGLCEKCYERPIRKCDICDEYKIINCIKNGKHLCKNCYSTPEATCVSCGRIAEVHSRTESGPICHSCYSKQYKAPKKTCSTCGRRRTVQKNIDNFSFCKLCWEKRRRKEGGRFQIICCLRSRLREAFSKFSKFGKRYVSSRYGIDWNAIIVHIGECPGKRADYHIDHIIPLACFDFNDPFEIWAAFHPTNHQWLLATDNLEKSNTVSLKAVESYRSKMRRLFRNNH